MSYRNACVVAALAGGFSSLMAVSAAPPMPAATPSGELAPNAALPRNLTDAERAYVQTHPLTSLRGFTPPSGYPNIRAVAEYEPMDAIIFSYNNGPSTWNQIIVQMIANITTTGDADAVVYVDSSSQFNSVSNQIAAGGADMGRVRLLARGLDSIWLRDYGPRYIYEGDVRSVIDHTYNRPRFNDNALNAYHAQVFGHTRYEIPLVHGGGNYHLEALGGGFSTRLINNENPGLSDAQIVQYWQQYQGVTTELETPFPTFIDSTQHIDMWMQVIADRKVVISDWPTQSGTTQDQICDSVANILGATGFTVYRTPAVSSGGTHYTFTNMVMCNDLVLLPTYTNSTVVSNNFNQQSLAVLESALPAKTVVQVPCQAIVTSAGVMHCIVMHMPRHLGGENPTALVRSPNGGEQLNPGDQIEVRWSTDDRDGVANVDLMLSTDGGATFPTVLASATADDGSYLWTVPDVAASNALVRVVARGDDGDTGSDDSDSGFAILGGCPGDTNGDNIVNFADLNAVLASFGQNGVGISGDVNGDGVVNFSDLNEVLAEFGADCN